APVLVRHRANPNVQGFVKGAYAAAIGTILGACVLLGRIAIGDWLTALVGLASLGVLFRWKVSNPALIAAPALIGLIAFPLLPPRVTPADVAQASRVVSFGCDLGDLARPGVDVERWDDVPAVGEDFDRARAAIRARVARLFGFMRPEPGTSR